MERLINNIFIAVFAVIGLTALVGAVGFGAYHQFVIAAMCAILIKALRHENG
jgi:ABC-type methionine transport system permease subunit